MDPSPDIVFMNGPIELEQSVNCLMQSYQKIQKSPGYQENRTSVDGQLLHKLGLPIDTPVSDQAFRSVMEKAREEYEDKPQLVENATAFIGRILEGRRTIVTPEEQRILAAHVASDCLLRYELLSFGSIKLDYLDLRTGQKKSHYTPESMLIAHVPDIRTPWHDTPLELPSDYRNTRWQRGVEQYPTTHGRNPIQLLDEIYAKVERPLHVLDIGRGDTHFLNEVSKHYGKNVKTYGIGLMMERYTDRPIDDDRIQPAEILPVVWGDTMDAVFSNVTLRYVMYPDKVLGEVMRVLRPGGHAVLDIYAQSSQDVFGALQELWPYVHSRFKTPEEVVRASFAQFHFPDAHTELNQKGILALTQDLAGRQGYKVECEFERSNLHIHKQ